MCKIIEKIIIREPGLNLDNKEHVENFRKLISEVIGCDSKSIEFRYYESEKIEQEFNDGLFLC